MWKALIAGALAAAIAFAAPRPETNELRSAGNGPDFRAQFGQRLSTDEDSLRLMVIVSIPYDNLVFLRTDSGFSASFELVSTLLREKGGLVGERIRDVRVEALTYAETNSRTQNAVHSEEFLVSPGDYKVRVTLTDATETSRKSRWEDTISLATSDPALRLSDIYWIQEDTSVTAFGAPRLVESFYSTENSAHACVQLFTSGPDSIRLTWSVTEENGDTSGTDVRWVAPLKEVQTINYVLRISELPGQAYTLNMVAEGNDRREERSRKFAVRLPGVPSSITNLTDAIRQLKYIATSDEYKRLRQAEPRDRERLFRDFWKQRDPSPNSEQNELMDEYYHRVQYATENFGTNREGWETDRGRIYVTYGPPSDIERHPFEASSRPYEIWYYNDLAKRFVFVDYTGFGDYTLASPEWGY